MKKVFFAAALLALTTILTTVQAEVIMNSENIVAVTQDDDGFADVKLEDLNEVVRGAVLALVETNDLISLKYNAEKELTKVVLSNKEDQTQKTVYLNNEGKEVKYPVVEKDVEQVDPELDI